MIHSLNYNTYRGLTPFRRSILFLVVCMCFGTCTHGQFAPAAGSPGSTAIAYDSSSIVAWATHCSVQRGYRNVALTDSGYASAGDSSAAIGMATTNGIVSLGDGGSAILTFAQPIANGTGFDFAVFENGFAIGGPGMAFLELGFVEVSSDGVRYVRFPATDNVQDSIQIWNGGTMDCSRLNNLAGKYTSGYGTPFDLDELKDSAGLDINNITHVKVIDVIGTLDSTYASRDAQGHKINDPYPTTFASSGFDLDAVGVLSHLGPNGTTDITGDNSISIYPIPVVSFVNIKTQLSGTADITLTDITGKQIQQVQFEKETKLNLSEIPAGVYTIKVIAAAHVFTKLIVKE